MIEQTIKAKQVQEGDFLPGLDNGYVYTDPEPNRGYLSYPETSSGGYASAMPGDTLLISYHDALGDEVYLLIPENSRLTVRGVERDIEDDEDDD